MVASRELYHKPGEIEGIMNLWPWDNAEVSGKVNVW